MNDDVYVINFIIIIIIFNLTTTRHYKRQMNEIKNNNIFIL